MYGNLCLQRGGDLDFHQSVLGQTGDLNGGPGGIAPLGKERGIHLIHGAEVVHVAQEYRGLDHFVHAAPGGLQNRLHIGEGLPGLGLNPLGERAGGGINGQLTGSDDQSIE